MTARRILPTFPETWLHRVWERRDLIREPLRTVDGRSVRILDPGRPNDGDGPDVLDATLLFEGTPRRGDVEFHLESRGWYLHRHDADPRYRDVVLHVVLRHTTPDLGVRHRDQGRVPTVELAGQLRIPIGRLARHLSARRATRGCPLDEAVVPTSQRRSRLDALGEVRFLRKAARHREAVRVFGRDEAFYRALADALGYAANREPFVRLAARVRWDEIRRMTEEDAVAYLLGAAGLLPSQRGIEVDASASSFERRWETFPSRPEPLEPGAWRNLRLRRGNGPTRRVVALARLVARFRDGFLPELRRLAQCGDPSTHWRERWDAFRVEAGTFWSQHIDFGRPARRRMRHLVGETRARDIWVNVALPALLVEAEEERDDAFRARVVALYRHHPPLQPNRKTAWVTEHVLFGIPDDERTEPAARQQGMLELFTRYCEPRRCAECPLSESRSANDIMTKG